MSSHLYSEPQPRLLYSAARNQTTQLCIYCESTRVSVAHTLYIEQPQRRTLYSYGKNIYTVGADKNGTLVFVHFSAQAASISIISVAIINVSRMVDFLVETQSVQSAHAGGKLTPYPADFIL